ncbi:MAG TPA: hypothetical protein VG407_18840 [Caulobacteraceae bacterium]|jgi:hypothetical protein|nr:hypothetical protein [Caulobacteraceae bacterium]
MKRNILLTAGVLALGLFSAEAAVAQSSNTSTGSVTVNGFVALRCSFTSENVVLNIGEMAIQSGSSSTLGAYDHTKLDGLSTQLDGLCNGAGSTMTVQAFPMLNTAFTSAPPSGFDNRVDYTATATENSVSATATSTSATPGAPVTVGDFSNAITVNFSNSATPGGGKMVAGPYTGSVNVTLTPST